MATWITVLYDNVGLSNVYASAFLYAASNVPSNIATYFLLDPIGRKPVLLWSMLGATLAALMFAFFSDESGDAATIIFVSMLYNALTICGWNAINCLSTETFPTLVRATALGTLSAFGRVGSISAQVVNGSLQAHVALLLAVTAATMLSGALAAFGLPTETSRTALD